MAPDTSRMVADGREHEAVAGARQRLELKKSVVGEHHPDYAKGLNQLALLMIIHGDPAGAEPLLRQALAIRKEALGEGHPDYAKNLSSLAGLLWARSDLDGAEPLLRQAVEIRRASLGERHPKTIDTLKSLDQLNQARRERLDRHEALAGELARPTGIAGEGAGRLKAREAIPSGSLIGELADGRRTHDAHDRTTAPRPPERSGAVPAWSLPMSPSGNDLSRELAALSDAFSDLGGRLLHTARQLHAPGTPPPESLLDELGARRRDFFALRDRARSRAEALHVACPPPEALDGLQGLTSLLDDVAEAEIRQARSEEVRRRALAVLGRVLALSHVSDGEFPALRDCQDQARTLHAAIREGSWTGLPAEAERLAEGEHPFVSLLTLVEDREELRDDLWATLHEAVGNTFGKGLATAAARARLILKDAPGRWDGSPHCGVGFP